MDDRKQQEHRPAGGSTAPAAGNTPEPADERPWELPEYVHERELGAGASGRVVLARHRATGTPVAVKYLHSAAGTPALRAEAEVLAGLDSPHVTRLYEYVEGERGAAMVMELVDGIALRELLRAEGATTPEAALVVLKGSLLGLAAAHGAGVVHRDYKPANVLVDTAGTSKLVDFGIAVPSGDERDVSGTPAYMPPEQWAGRPASPAGDVYAATVTFFECLTGARPYGGTTFAELAVQHTEAPIPAELTPDPVRPLILSGLAKDPGARPDSATALLAELEAVAAAGYGPGWEEKGRLDLTALVALLALLLPGAGAAAGAVGGTSLAHTALGGGGSAALDSSTGGSSAVHSSAVQSAASQSSAGTGAAPVAVVRETLIRRAARTGTRGKALTGVAAGALTLATLAGMAVAGAVDGDSRTVVGGVAPEATTSIGPFDPAGAASPLASPATTEGQDSPSPGPSDPSATPAPDASTAGAPGSGPSSPGASSTGPGGRSTGPSAAPTGRTSPGTPPTPGTPGTARPPLPPGSAAPSSGPAVPGSVPPPSVPPATAPATGPVVAPSSATPAGPTGTTPSPTLTVLPTRTVAPTIAVTSVNLDSLACAGRWSTTATVTVVAQGAATGSLTLTWFHTLGERTVDVATDTVAVHDGRATVSRTHDFTSADTFPTWGVRIGTAPAAARPGRTSDTVSAFLCDPPR
ncbi:serine/threonine-protein kinase [Kitasatospora purpeofusca]|uniref:serine/threonine-protein kinase n=1 Tax=Kitasatospora purpeofusca TaxID=67352 RepID=UPI0006899515|nr:serine/threonine-protein kinase [Kitasatospora purpeofusca]